MSSTYKVTGWANYVREKLSDISLRLFVADGNSHERLRGELDNIVRYLLFLPEEDLKNLPYTREFKLKISEFESDKFTDASEVLRLLSESLFELTNHTCI